MIYSLRNFCQFMDADLSLSWVTSSIRGVDCHLFAGFLLSTGSTSKHVMDLLFIYWSPMIDRKFLIFLTTSEPIRSITSEPVISLFSIFTWNSSLFLPHLTLTCRLAGSYQLCLSSQHPFKRTCFSHFAVGLMVIWFRNWDISPL